MMYEIVYFSPYYDEGVHGRIIGLLDVVRRRHGTSWREVAVREIPGLSRDVSD